MQEIEVGNLVTLSGTLDEVGRICEFRVLLDGSKGCKKDFSKSQIAIKGQLKLGDRVKTIPYEVVRINHEHQQYFLSAKVEENCYGKEVPKIYDLMVYSDWVNIEIFTL